MKNNPCQGGEPIRQLNPIAPFNVVGEPTLPPHDSDLEAAVIGCLFANPVECFLEFQQSGLPITSFYETHHQLVVRAIRAVMLQRNNFDELTVYGKLKEWGRESEVGGLETLVAFQGRMASPAMFSEYLKDLRVFGYRRTTQSVGILLQQNASNPCLGPEQIHTDLELALAGLKSSTDRDALPPLIDAAEPIPNDWKEPEEIVSGLLHRGSKMVLGGGSKSNKTWALLDLAISISSGEPWWGFKTRKGKVLYLNFEIQKEFFQKRIEWVANAKHIRLAAGQLSIMNLRGHAADFSILLPKIAEKIKGSDYSLIVLDPIYKGLGKRVENDAGDMAELLNEIERLAVDTGAAVVFGAHFSKGNQAGKESIDRISGSGVFARDPDTILVMTKHENEGAFTVESSLRNFKAVEPFCVRWLFPLMRYDDQLDPAKLKQAKGGRPKKNELPLILELVKKEPLTTTQWLKRAVEDGISRGGFYQLKKEAVSKGCVIQKDDKWLQNPSGPESPITGS